ncbi:hypothetical protein HYS00_02190 [Candidatus Microgenomates bacterium]|nr:hypothetical protein [Candidatus Microgenomates bacterium]
MNEANVRVNDEFYKIFDIPANNKTKANIKKLVNDGLITTDGKSDEYKITQSGLNELALDFPFVRYINSSWDGIWRIVSYEIPEKKREMRDRLRREMAGWGLGPWHRSFWVTPHPIIDNLHLLIKGKDESQYVQAFESDHKLGDRDVLIEKVWGRSSLEEKYKLLFKRWHEILSLDDDKHTKFSKVVGHYVGMLRIDPGLPKELVGDKWIGNEAYTIYKEIKNILLTP